MKNLKSIGYFLVLALIAFGLIAATCLCASQGYWFYALCLVLAGAAAVPTAVWLWKKMWNG